MKSILKIIKKNLINIVAYVLYYFHTLINNEICNNKISILMYHKISNEDDPIGLNISPNIFDQQIDYLVRNFKIIAFEDAIYKLLNNKIDRQYFVISFDDGYRNNYTNAFKILKKYNVPATIFITLESLNKGLFKWDSLNEAILNCKKEKIFLKKLKLKISKKEDKIEAIGFLHRKLKTLNDSDLRICQNIIIKQCNTKHIFKERKMLNKNEINEMVNSGLITLGSHTITHPILTKVNYKRAFKEIYFSKKMLEKIFNCKVKYFSYPNGKIEDFNERIENLVRSSGYEGACSTILGSNSDKKNIFQLRRINITNDNCLNIRKKFSSILFFVRITGIGNNIIFRE